MKTSAKPDADTVVAAVIGGAAAATLFAALLAGIAKPPNLHERLVRVRQTSAQAKALAAGPGDASLYPTGSLCAGAADTAAAELRRRVELAAAAAKVTLVSITAQPRPLTIGLEGAAPLSLQIEATGAYDNLVKLMRALAAFQPLLFADSADLAAEVTTARLKFSGHAYCSTSDLH